jgi:alpha-L-fucosidase 2
LYVEAFDRYFTNEGHGTLHNACHGGFTLIGVSAVGPAPPGRDCMQMDGGMGSVAAIQEMLLHTRRGVHHVFAGAPDRWRDVSFRRMRTDGAFLVGAERKGGVVTKITLESPAGGTFRLANPWDRPATVTRKGAKPKRARGKVLAIRTKPGEKLTVA